MHKTIHPGDDSDRLNMSRKVGGRKMINMKDNADASIRAHEACIKKSK